MNETERLKQLAKQHGFNNLVEHEEDIEKYCPEYQDTDSVSCKIKCSTCIYKFECLAKHHIPENYGNDCKKYMEV